MLVLAPVPHLVFGIFHPEFKGLSILSRTPRKALAQFTETGWQDEQVQQTPTHQFILTRSDLDGTLHINIEQHVNASQKVFVHMALEGPIPAIMNAGMFKKLTPLNPSQKVILLQEKIVHTINLTGPRFSRRA
jgi:hypothetical protein